MRVWDLSAGYLNRQSLLGEHREVHGVNAILVLGKKGYSRHPETMRWARALTGLACRHRQLAAEMRLRGYHDRTPLGLGHGRSTWPAVFVTEPGDQIALLRQKYVGKAKGRIPLPRNPQELWAHHKYSVMARDPEAYRVIGRVVSRMHRYARLHDLARELVVALREVPARGRLVNALEHMWGHVRQQASAEDEQAARGGLAGLQRTIQALALRHHEKYLLSSTALSELEAFFEAA